MIYSHNTLLIISAKNIAWAGHRIRAYYVISILRHMKLKRWLIRHKRDNKVFYDLSGTDPQLIGEAVSLLSKKNEVKKT